MKTLQYSFAQIEAFATIAETGSLSQAAARTLTLLFTYFCVDSKHFFLS